MPTAHLDRRTAKQLVGACCYGACQERALDGSDYCAPHDAHERGRDAAKKRRQRLERVKAGRCITGCGRKVGKRRVKRKWIAMRWCSTCARARAKAQREARKANRRVVPGASRDVPVDSKAPRTKLEVHPDGYVRVRTTGRGVRGQKSRAELDDDLRQDLDDSIRDAQAVRDEGIADLRAPAISDLGRVAKREAHALVADRLLRAARTLTSVAESLCPGRVRELEQVIVEAER